MRGRSGEAILARSGRVPQEDKKADRGSVRFVLDIKLPDLSFPLNAEVKPSGNEGFGRYACDAAKSSGVTDGVGVEDGRQRIGSINPIPNVENLSTQAERDVASQGIG